MNKPHLKPIYYSGTLAGYRRYTRGGLFGALTFQGYIWL